MSPVSTPTTPAPPTTTVTVRYFAGAKAAAGVGAETTVLPGGAAVADLLVAVRATHGPALARVLAASSYLLDGVAVHDHAAALPDGAVVDVLPPFAGG